ncbi:MAG: (d)CMP kinase [Lactobacillaceae bacterium]
MQIAIDGPASSGKSTVAKKLAKKLNFIYIDTGAMYRALTYFALKNQVNLNNENEIIPLFKSLNFRVTSSKDGQHFWVNNEDVTDKIRQPDVADHVSQVATYPQVRNFLSKLQRKMAKQQNVIMDGRDIGTVILPQANYKFFVTASPEVRAHRRFLENQERGIDTSLSKLTESIKKRDKIDSQRKVAPLKKAPDAELIDTSDLNISEVVSLLLSKIRV